MTTPSEAPKKFQARYTPMYDDRLITFTTYEGRTYFSTIPYDRALVLELNSDRAATISENHDAKRT